MHGQRFATRWPCYTYSVRFPSQEVTMRIATAPTADLTALIDNREAVRQFLARRYRGAIEPTEEMIDAIEAEAEAELERRDYDADDPASPQNTATDARDTEPRAWYRDEI